MSQPSSLRAIFYALAGFTCWVLGDMFMKLLGELGVPNHQVMIFGGLSGLISIFTVTACRKELPRLHPRKRGVLATLGFLFFLNYIIWLTALKHLPLANFYSVLFLAPTVGSIVAVFLLREPLNIRKVIAIIIGFSGVVIAVNPATLFSERNNWVGYGVAFCGMLVVVTQMLLMRYVGHNENRENIAFYPRIAAVLGGLAGLFLFGYEPMSGKAWLYCFGTGMIGSMGWMFMAHAYKLAPAATVAPFHYSQIISGALLGYFIWHDVPSTHLLVGATVIIASGVYLVTHARRSEKLIKTVVETP